MDNENKSQTVVCKNCGKDNNVNSELCSECGTLLKDGWVSCYKSMWKRAFDFKGRSSKSEFIKAYLANALLFFILEIAALYLSVIFSLIEWLFLIVLALFVLSQLAVGALTVRRLHDAGKSGWWELFSFIAIIGNIIIFIICYYFASAIILSPFQCVYGPPNDVQCVYGPPGES